MQNKDLKSVQSLYGRHQEETIYIVGSGASMRVFPVDFLADKITIGLNMAWKSAPVKYGITIHPNLNVPEFMEGEASRPDITWITTLKKSRMVLSADQLVHAQKHFYFFRNDGQKNTSAHLEPLNIGRIPDWVRQPTEDYLYVWSSIAQPAANLAANMGAKNIVLVGCDNCSLLHNHHAHKQHTQWQGSHPEDRYREYYEGMAEVRSALNERGVTLISLTPFLGLDAYERDFSRLCTELNREPLVQGGDRSAIALPNWRRAFRGAAFQLREHLRLGDKLKALIRSVGAK